MPREAPVTRATLGGIVTTSIDQSEAQVKSQKAKVRRAGQKAKRKLQKAKVRRASQKSKRKMQKAKVQRAETTFVDRCGRCCGSAIRLLRFAF
jgi:hypothetical protein